MAVGYGMDGLVVMCYISTWQKQLVSIANESYIFVAMKFTAKSFSIFHKEDWLYSIRFFSFLILRILWTFLKILWKFQVDILLEHLTLPIAFPILLRFYYDVTLKRINFRSIRFFFFLIGKTWSIRVHIHVLWYVILNEPMI